VHSWCVITHVHTGWRRRWRCLWLLSLVATGAVRAVDLPPVVLEHITTADGLPQGDVLATLQDSQGFIWLGTEDGLIRYDGRDFTRYAYSRTATGGLPGNYVQSIVEDAHHDLWIAVNDAGLARWNRATDKFTIYRHNSADPNSLASDAGCSILIDGRGRVWIGTRDSGIDILNPATGAIRHVRHDETVADSLVDDRIQVLTREGSGAIWVGTEHGLDRTEQSAESFAHFRHSAADPHSLSSDQISQVVEEQDGSMWIGTLDGGINHMERSGRVAQIYRHEPSRPTSLASSDVRAMLVDRFGHLWVGTIDGLDLLDRSSGTFTHYRHDDHDPGSLRDSYVVSLYEDSSGLVWIGTREGGVSRWNPRNWELGGRRPAWLAGKPVTAFAQASAQNVWVASLDGDLMEFDATSGERSDIDRIAHRGNAIGNRRVMALHADRQRTLWIGLMDGGLRRLWPDGHVDAVLAKPGDPRSLSAAAIMTLYEARDGKLWIGTHGGGANLLDPSTGLVRQLPYDAGAGAISAPNVTAFAEDHEGNLWIGTQGGGLDLARGDGSVMRVFRHDADQPASLSSNTIYAITVDDAGRVWIATEGGGLELVHGSSTTPESIRFENFSRADNLTSDTIYGVLPDSDGRLWLSGNAGLMRFDPRTHAVKAFHVEQGSQGEEFDFGASLRLHDGRLCFGGPGGFNVFDPSKLTEETQPPRLALTRVEVLGVPLQSKTPYWLMNSIDVDSHASILSLDFGALDFTSARRNRLSYRMAGLTDRWIDLGTQRRVTLTNLDAGDHILEVRGASADSAWSVTPLRVKIHMSPAPWKSAWAFAIYACALICAIAYVVWLQRRKIALVARTQQRLEAEVAARTQDLVASNRLLEEAAKAKGDFLARMTHELRTPMNGVVGMTELLARTPLSDVQTRLTKTIRSSAEVLLQIVNDMLDLSKAQAGKIELENLPIDLGLLIEECAALFESAAAAKGLELTVCPPSSCAESLLGDPLRIRQIVMNLIGNAIKFTGNGQVVIESNVTPAADGGVRVDIVVTDSGIGMTAASAARIFEPFTQADESTSRRFGGTGLGLAICRELTSLMGGMICVESRPGIGSTFKVALALRAASQAARGALAHVDRKVLILTHQPALADSLRRHARNFGLSVVESEAESDFAIVDAGTHAPYVRACLAEPNLRMPLVIVAASAEAEDLELLPRIDAKMIVPRLVQCRDLYRACAAALGTGTQTSAECGSLTPSVAKLIGGHVLVVDDEPVNAAVAEGYLAALGCTSVWVEEGAAALARVAKERFDLILMDVSMPGMDGFQTTALIREREPADRRVPIVALTAHDSVSYRDRCLAAGMDDLLEKPYSLEACASVLRSLISTMRPPLAAPGLAGVDGTVVAAVRRLSPHGHGDLYSRLVSLFRKSSAADMSRLRAALAVDDLVSAGAICHKLKASADNVGASSFAAGLRDLERRCMSGDSAGCPEYFAILDANYPALLEELEHTLKATA
jgi:signal transduction histidine kinase/ligand-binding sensor domain-containing protein